MLDIRFRVLTRWPRPEKTKRQRTAQFSVKYPGILDRIERELNYLLARDIVIEIDMTQDQIRNDGWPRGGAAPKTTGIILSFDSKFGPMALPCDYFNNWQANLNAIGLHLECLRRADAYGVSTSGEQYKGWAALPEKATGGFTIEDAAAYIGNYCEHTAVWILASSQNMLAGYRRASKTLHPDGGGSKQDWHLLTSARELLEGHFAKAKQ